jgi:HEAT repeat protein
MALIPARPRSTRLVQRRATHERILVRQHRRKTANPPVRWLRRAMLFLRLHGGAHPWHRLRQAMLTTVGALPPDDLLVLLRDPCALVRLSTVAALCCQEAPIPIALIWYGLRDLDERFTVAMLLADQGEAFPFAAVHRLLLTHPDEQIRLCALAALDARCPPATLAVALSDPAPLVRRLAADLVAGRQSSDHPVQQQDARS